MNKESSKDLLEKLENRFINREISWLEFNHRVVEESLNLNHPLLERLKFLGISSSNLNEFYMVRVAGVKAQIRHNISYVSIDGLTPKEQLIAIKKSVTELVKKQQNSWLNILESLKEHRIYITTPNLLTKKQQEYIRNYFYKSIFPALTPLAIDNSHPFPMLQNLGLDIVITLKYKNTRKLFRAVIPLPNKLPRFVQFPQNIANGTEFILLEEIIKLFIPEMFKDAEVKDMALISITRDSEIEVSGTAEDLISHFEVLLKQRRSAVPIRLEIDNMVSAALKKFLMKELNLEETDLIVAKEIMGLSSAFDLYNLIDEPKLKFPKYTPIFPSKIKLNESDFFEELCAKDTLIHHPYQTFDVVIDFLEKAAKDPDVVTIKQTLYRVGNNSNIVKALIRAAEAGKSVTVVVELKARFDEEANIRWAKDLEKAGAQVIYGIANMKIHAKMSIVVKRVGNELVTYAHFGTGNYHSVAALTYADLSVFTKNRLICEDLINLFNFITGYCHAEKFNKIIVAPLNLRENLLSFIDNEIKNAKQGKAANIWMKLNSLVDDILIDALYKASNAGVKIKLIVRGICCLKPGVKGLSENIEVKSIIGRFLEHARIFAFGNGHKLPSIKSKLFIASADLMPRNLSKRIEVMLPIEDQDIQHKIMHEILMKNFEDEKQSWNLDSKGNYRHVKVRNKNAPSLHEWFMLHNDL